MRYDAAQGILIPFWGTSIGAACVYFIRGSAPPRLEKLLAGFAGGIMTAASFFSLILPALERSAHWGRWAFIPAAAGFLLGMAFLFVLDGAVLRLKSRAGMPRGGAGLSRIAKLVLAVTLHNLPEGVAVGVVYVGLMAGAPEITRASALALAIGIALQNLPEGAIVSMPLRSSGMGKGRAFLCGVLSGAVEPLGALATVYAAGFFLPLFPYLLSFAAGAMFYVVAEELIPQMNEEPRSHAGIAAFAAGFALMMAMDVGLG